MRIARPPEGFAIRCVATVEALLSLQAQQQPQFIRYWDDIVERLKFTAHREGQPEERLGRGYRLLALDGDRSAGRPRVVLGYLVLGDTVTIKLLRISG